MHVDLSGDELFRGEDEIEKDGEEDEGCKYYWYDHVGSVCDVGNVESA